MGNHFNGRAAVVHTKSERYRAKRVVVGYGLVTMFDGEREAYVAGGLEQLGENPSGTSEWRPLSKPTSIPVCNLQKIEWGGWEEEGPTPSGPDPGETWQ